MRRIVLSPRVSETVSPSRPHAADNLSSCASVVEGNLLARASSFESAWQTDSERSTAEGNLRLSPNQETTKAVVERSKRREEVQTCRQIAANNTVILKENQNNQTSEGSEEPAAQGVTLIAKGDLDQERVPIHDRSWSFVPCSRDLPGNEQSVFFVKDSLFDKAHRET